MDHKELWKAVFGDTDKYIEFYFKEKAGKSIVYSKYDRENLVSMAFFTPYEIVCRGEESVCPFIVGVATAPEHRRQGCMKMLLEHGLMEARERGARMAFLSPEDVRIYQPLGFQSASCRHRLEVVGHRKKWYSVSSFSRLDTAGKNRVAEFANAQLYAADLDLYIKRSSMYYEVLHRERKALDGKVIVLNEGSMIRAVAAYIHEEDFYEVTEVICAPEDGRFVVESICAYLSETEDRRVVFSDSYFLPQVAEAGFEIKKEEKPYIMLKFFDEEVRAEELNVYINEIT